MIAWTAFLPSLSVRSVQSRSILIVSVRISRTRLRSSSARVAEHLVELEGV
jgi:hypothetical protein